MTETTRKIIINNKTDILSSKAMEIVGGIINQGKGESGLYEKFTEFNVGSFYYTVIAKKGSGSDIFTIFYTGYEHTV